MVRRVVQLREVARSRRAAVRKEVRRELFRSARGVSSHDNLAGYALVAWDRTGQCFTAVRCLDGPIGASMVPALAQGALCVHVSCDAALDEMYEDDEPPEGAS